MREAAAILRPLADVAQLVERLLAMQKVDGSSPFIRFNKAPGKGGFFMATTAARNTGTRVSQVLVRSDGRAGASRRFRVR